MKKPTRKRIVVVLGMHRSGTSAVARGLKVLGVDLGERLMPGVAGNNDKGFWEDIDANAINRELMRALGRDWDTLTPIDSEAFGRADLEGFRVRAANLLRERLDGNAVYGLKDPRISMLLPFWKAAFRQVDADASYVICTRHPLSVARSLEKRDGIEPEKSHYLWLDHVATVVLESRGASRIVVSYDLLMREPAAQLRRLASALRLPFEESSPEFAEYSREFLSEDLRHSVFGLQDLQGAPNVPAAVVEAHLLLEKFARDESSVDSEEAQAFFESAQRNLDAIRPALAYMSRRDLEVSRLQNTVEEFSIREGLQAHPAVARHLEEFRNLTQVIAEKDRHIADLQVIAAARDGQIHGLNVAAAEREGRNALAVAEREGRIRDLKLALRSLRSRFAREAALVDEIARRLQAGQFHGAAPPDGFRSLEQATTDYARRLLGISEFLTDDRIEHPDPAALSDWIDKAFELRHASWKQVESSGHALATSLVESDVELEINRLRLLDSLRESARTRAEVEQARARVTELEAALRERERILGQFGHQFVSRVGSVLDPYPGVRWVITAPLRFIHWILGNARA